MTTPHARTHQAAAAAEQARLALEQVRLLAKLHPDVSHHLESAIAGLRREARRTPRRDRDDVLLALERYSGLTFHEVREETGLRPERVAEILWEFIRRGLVECRPARARAATRIHPRLRELLREAFALRGVRGDFRAEHLFALTHTPAACSYMPPGPGRSPLAAIAELA